MVGFVRYCIDEDDGEYWIYRMRLIRNINPVAMEGWHWRAFGYNQAGQDT
jgi:hypothetical protein